MKKMYFLLIAILSMLFVSCNNDEAFEATVNEIENNAPLISYTLQNSVETGSKLIQNLEFEFSNDEELT
ncbi:MAG: hypothetical protein LUF85_10950 [Bacteroides sp.]|nr:hypothetical protein [Bacteroides sp.]